MPWPRIFDGLRRDVGQPRPSPEKKVGGGPAQPSVLDPAWKPSPELISRYIAEHWECATRAEAKAGLRQQELERLAALAEQTLEVRSGMSLRCRASLGNIIEIGHPTEKGVK